MSANAASHSGNLLLSQILEGEAMAKPRFQNPRLLQNANGSWYIRPWVDVRTKAGVERHKKTIVVAPPGTGKRKAETAKNKIMLTLNQAAYVIRSQVTCAELLDAYERSHIKRDGLLAASTRAKYTIHIKNHIRPEFGALMLCEITPLRIESWLDSKKLSWATKADLRNLLSGIFKKASDWGLWNERNPVELVEIGRPQKVRERRKLTDEETRLLLAALPEMVRLIVEIALFCTLSISEALGLCWKHIDFERGLVLVRQRFHRGDLDIPKTINRIRDVELGYLIDRLAMFRGEPDEYVFNVKTRWGICRDDRGLNQHFLRKAAKKLGLYYQGFGFHAFRREAITAISAAVGLGQAMRAAGHSKADMSLAYTLSDSQAREKAIRERQEQILGKVEGPPQ